eukprot:scaffold65854_cov63-Phaeocystis_antarctica.AAC.1
MARGAVAMSAAAVGVCGPGCTLEGWKRRPGSVLADRKRTVWCEVGRWPRGERAASRAACSAAAGSPGRVGGSGGDGSSNTSSDWLEAGERRTAGLGSGV